MSAVPQSATIRFFGILKNLFSRPETSGNGAPKPTPEPEPTSKPTTTTTPVSAPQASTAAAPQPVRTSVPRHYDNQGGKIVVLPLQTVIMSMSKDLRAKVRSVVGEDLTVSVTVEKILPQLGKGVVKIPYGDVRRAAPDVFVSGTDYDNLPVVLPLSEILPRINPSSLSRRPGQKRMEEISNDIASPFAAGGQGLKISNETPKPAPTPSTQFTKRVPPVTASQVPRTVIPARPAAKTQRIAIAPVTALPPSRATPAPAAVPLPESQRIPMPAAPPTTPSAPRVVATPQTPTPLPESQRIPMPAATPIFARVAAKPQAVTPEPRPVTPVSPVKSDIRLSALTALSAAPAATVTPVAPAVVAAPAVPSAPPLKVALSAMVENWPETMQQEIMKLNLAGAQVELPSNLVQQGLKRGRVSFTWKALRSWLRPTPLSIPSLYDEIEFELPLKVLAPMFLSAQKAAGKSEHAKVVVEESIPNLFFGFPQPEAIAPAPPVAPSAAPAPAVALTAAPAFEFTAAPAATPAITPVVAPVATPVVAPNTFKTPDTNYYVWDDNADTAFIDAAEFKRKPEAAPSTETDFIARFATPNEVVSRAAALDGVAGAIIALPDGLSVASKIPEDLNGDTLAAFLPQLFSKMSQCTKELRMGELNNLNFTVGNIPWKIFRVNAVFFAAFGRAGQGLPTAQLTALAVELDHKNKR